MPRHNFPSSVHADNLSAALALCSGIIADSEDVIACDAVGLKFVDPVGLCLLAATCHRLAVSERKIKLENAPPAVAAYLSRMDLFKACGIEYSEKFTRHDRRSDLVEICIADKAADIDTLASKITNALVGVTPDFDPAEQPDEMTGFISYDYLRIPLNYIFSELLENALTHGKREGYKNARAWIAAQYYPANDRIRLAVVDDGCGFLASLRKHPALEHQDHASAIRLALLPRITCNPDLEIMSGQTANQGIGLTVIKEIVSSGQGTMRLVSGDFLLEQITDDKRREYRVPAWQGVILALEFKRESLKKTNLRSIIQKLRDKPGARGLRFE